MGALMMRVHLCDCLIDDGCKRSTDAKYMRMRASAAASGWQECTIRITHYDAPIPYYDAPVFWYVQNPIIKACVILCSEFLVRRLAQWVGQCGQETDMTDLSTLLVCLPKIKNWSVCLVDKACCK